MTVAFGHNFGEREDDNLVALLNKNVYPRLAKIIQSGP